jgi:multiple sugar transport system substrate-binding protein
MKEGNLRFSAVIWSVTVLVLLFAGISKIEAKGGADQKGIQSPARILDESAVTGSINYYGRPDDNKVESTIVANFEKKYPNIKVNYVELPDSSNDRLKTINTVLQTGDSSIDVFAGDVVWPPIFVSAGWVIPLDDYIQKSDLDQYLPGPLSAFQMKGKTYGLPFMADSGALYYRKDILDKYKKPIPKSWDELVETSMEIMKTENNPELSGFCSYWMQNESLTCALLEAYWPLGGDVVGADGKSIIDKNKLTEALTQMRKMITDSKIAVKGIETFGTNNARTVVMAGNTIFSRDWLSGYAPYNNPANSKVAGNMEITLLPSGGTLGGWGIMVSRFSRNKEAAIVFAKFRASYESQAAANEIVRIVPTIKAMYEDPEILKLTPHLPKFLPVMEKARPRPLSPYYAELSGIMQREIHSVISGMSTPETSAENITRQIKDLLN